MLIQSTIFKDAQDNTVLYLKIFVLYPYSQHFKLVLGLAHCKLWYDKQELKMSNVKIAAVHQKPALTVVYLHA